MTDDAGAVVERFFHSLNAGDWDTVRTLLATGVKRIGPQGERQGIRCEGMPPLQRAAWFAPWRSL
jgi:hypothetical protein